MGKTFLNLLLFAILATATIQAHGQPASSYNTGRVVVIGGVLTETTYALGMGGNVVGVDASSLYPAEAAPKILISYHRALSPEGVLSLKPTLVLATDAAGPPAALDQIRAAGIPVKIIKAEETEEGAKTVIRETAAVFGVEAKGEELVAAIEADLAKAKAMVQSRGGKKPARVLFLYARGQNVMMAGGLGSSGEWLIRHAGAVNAISGFEGYKPLNAEAMVAAAPDVIFMPERGLASIQSLNGLLAQPGVGLTPAGRNKTVVTIDDSQVMNFGPRLGQAVQTLILKLYPDVAASR